MRSIAQLRRAWMVAATSAALFLTSLPVGTSVAGSARHVDDDDDDDDDDAAGSEVTDDDATGAPASADATADGTVMEEPATASLPPPEPGPRRPWYRDWTGNSLVLGGLVSAGVGTLLWSLGRSDAQSLNDASDHETYLSRRDDASSALREEQIGVAAMILGGGLIVAGLWHSMRSNPSSAERVGAVPLPGGAAIYAGMDF